MLIGRSDVILVSAKIVLVLTLGLWTSDLGLTIKIVGSYFEVKAFLLDSLTSRTFLIYLIYRMTD